MSELYCIILIFSMVYPNYVFLMGLTGSHTLQPDKADTDNFLKAQEFTTTEQLSVETNSCTSPWEPFKSIKNTRQKPEVTENTIKETFTFSKNTDYKTKQMDQIVNIITQPSTFFDDKSTKQQREIEKTSTKFEMNEYAINKSAKSLTTYQLTEESTIAESELLETIKQHIVTLEITEQSTEQSREKSQVSVIETTEHQIPIELLIFSTSEQDGNTENAGSTELQTITELIMLNITEQLLTATECFMGNFSYEWRIVTDMFQSDITLQTTPCINQYLFNITGESCISDQFLLNISEEMIKTIRQIYLSMYNILGQATDLMKSNIRRELTTATKQFISNITKEITENDQFTEQLQAATNIFIINITEQITTLNNLFMFNITNDITSEIDYIINWEIMGILRKVENHMLNPTMPLSRANDHFITSITEKMTTSADLLSSNITKQLSRATELFIFNITYQLTATIDLIQLNVTCLTELFTSTTESSTSTSNSWIDDIEQMIENKTNASMIMDDIVNNTSDDWDLETKTKVSSLLNETVELFLKQNEKKNVIEIVEDFMKKHSKVVHTIMYNAEDVHIQIVRNVISATEALAFGIPDIVEDKWKNYSFLDTSDNKTIIFTQYKTNLNQSCIFNTTFSHCSLLVKPITAYNHFTYGLVAIVFYGKHIANLSENAETNSSLNTPIMSLSVKSFEEVSENRFLKKDIKTNLSVMVRFDFVSRPRGPSQKIIHRALFPGEVETFVLGSEKCAYFDYSSGTWIENDSQQVIYINDDVQCEFNHLSTFAVLMQLHEYKRDPLLEVVTIACSCCSCIGLFITLWVLFHVKTIQTMRTTIGKHFCICLLIAHIMLATVFEKKFFYISDLLCAVYAVALHYIFLSAFCWMGVEALVLYRKTVTVFETKDYRWQYGLLGYGIPGLIVAVTMVVGFSLGHSPYGRPELCWLSFNYVWAFNGPAFIIVGVNCVLLIWAMKIAFTLQVNQNKTTVANLRTWLRGCTFLVILLGIPWLLGLAYLDTNNENISLNYIFTLANGLQGVGILIVRVLGSREVRRAQKQWLKTVSLKFRLRFLHWQMQTTEVIPLDLSDNKQDSEIDIKAFKSRSYQLLDPKLLIRREKLITGRISTHRVIKNIIRQRTKKADRDYRQNAEHSMDTTSSHVS